MTHAAWMTGLVVAGGLAVAGCASGGGATDTAGSAAPAATATLADAAGAPRGTARFTPVAGGMKLVFDGTGLPAGEHGIHVHTAGRCDAPDFASAGSHWNPTGRQHGSANPAGPHGGDMPNLTVAADGTTHYETVLQGAALTGAAGMLDADGAALLVHATADDYRTDPSGNSGARIACGIVTAG